MNSTNEEEIRAELQGDLAALFEPETTTAYVEAVTSALMDRIIRPLIERAEKAEIDRDRHAKESHYWNVRSRRNEAEVNELRTELNPDWGDYIQ